MESAAVKYARCVMHVVQFRLPCQHALSRADCALPEDWGAGAMRMSVFAGEGKESQNTH